MIEPLKPAGRTLKEFGPLKSAEQKLLDACRLGTTASISDKRPEAANDENTVRAAFLRFLALGGDEQAPVHEHGVQLVGAWIEGELDMEAASVPSNLTIRVCHFDVAPMFRGATIAGTLNFGGCQLPGLAGDGLVCDGCLFLSPDFSATEAVSLIGSRIGADLVCSDAKFDGKDGNALSADGAVIKGSLFLDKVAAMGKVQMIGVRIGGDFICHNAKLDGKKGEALSVSRAVIKGDVYLNDSFAATGKVLLMGVHIGGNLACCDAQFDGNNGLLAEGMVVDGTFFFRKLVRSVNGVSLAASHVRHLADDAGSWGEQLHLDGFVYDGIVGDAPPDAATRLAWLDKQLKSHAGLNGDGADFRPQPWRQLAKVLREMGHAEDVRQVSIAFEHRLRKANLIGQTRKHRNKLLELFLWTYRQISRAGHWLFWLFTGYGYRPLRLLVSMVVVWLVCAGFYWYAALAGVFAPSSPLVFQNPAYEVCRADHMGPDPVVMQGAGNWYLCEKLPEEYSGFSPLAYSLDVILPLVDLQQETSWAPLIPTPKEIWYKELFFFDAPKHGIRLVLWFEILFGWVSSLLLVAVVSGLTKRREE